LQPFAPLVALLVALLAAPLIAWRTQGRYYLARPETSLRRGRQYCVVCEQRYEPEEMSHCPAYQGPICSLCCSLDVRCDDLCKPHARLSSQWQARLPHIDLRYDWSQLPTLPGPHALPAYRAVQECLTNIARHSQASQVSLLGEQDGDWAVLTLRDNGVADTPPKYGCGLLGMQERLASIGGDMSARPHPDGGLLVVVRVPVLGLS